MSPISIIIVVVLLLLLLGGGYGYRSGYIGQTYPYGGYGLGIVGILIVVLLILLLTGRI